MVAPEPARVRPFEPVHLASAFPEREPWRADHRHGARPLRRAHLEAQAGREIVLQIVERGSLGPGGEGQEQGDEEDGTNEHQGAPGTVGRRQRTDRRSAARERLHLGRPVRRLHTPNPRPEPRSLVRGGTGRPDALRPPAPRRPGGCRSSRAPSRRRRARPLAFTARCRRPRRSRARETGRRPRASPRPTSPCGSPQGRSAPCRLCARLKEWRAVATRYGKTAVSFTAVLRLAATLEWIK